MIYSTSKMCQCVIVLPKIFIANYNARTFLNVRTRIICRIIKEQNQIFAVS